MRKVLFSIYIPPQFDQERAHKQLPGTGIYGPIETPGYCHAWGSYSSDGDVSPCAIVEDELGMMHNVPLSKMRFIDPIREMLAGPENS